MALKLTNSFLPNHSHRSQFPPHENSNWTPGYVMPLHTLSRIQDTAHKELFNHVRQPMVYQTTLNDVIRLERVAIMGGASNLHHNCLIKVFNTRTTLTGWRGLHIYFGFFKAAWVCMMHLLLLIYAVKFDFDLLQASNPNPLSNHSRQLL